MMKTVLIVLFLSSSLWAQKAVITDKPVDYKDIPATETIKRIIANPKTKVLKKVVWGPKGDKKITDYITVKQIVKTK
jgi:hypothetical protein